MVHGNLRRLSRFWIQPQVVVSGTAVLALHLTWFFIRWLPSRDTPADMFGQLFWIIQWPLGYKTNNNTLPDIADLAFFPLSLNYFCCSGLFAISGLLARHTSLLMSILIMIGFYISKSLQLSWLVQAYSRCAPACMFPATLHTPKLCCCSYYVEYSHV